MRSKLIAYFLLTSIIAVQAYTQDIEFADLGLPNSGRLVLLVQGTELGKFARAVDDASNGMLSEAMSEASFKGLKDTHLPCTPSAHVQELILWGWAPITSIATL
jgi:hypothetical protein